MDDIEVKEEYNVLPTKKFDIGSGNDDDNIDGEADIVQQDKASNIFMMQ